MYWNIQAVLVQAEGEAEPLIELQWGWTAGFTQEQLERYEGPEGYDSVLTTVAMAKELRDRLDQLIKQQEKKTEER